MPRKNDSAGTVSKILDTATELFMEKGYEQTTMQNIVDGLGMSKGAIFHHFKSKEEIMEAVIEQYSERFLTAAKQVADRKEMPIIERFFMTVAALSADDNVGRQIREHIHMPQNTLMHAKMERVLIDGATPIVAGVIKEGVEQGVFHTNYPEEIVEMMIYYTNSAFSDERVANLTPEALSKKVSCFIFIAERLLGVESGSLNGLVKLFEGVGGANE